MEPPLRKVCTQWYIFNLFFLALLNFQQNNQVTNPVDILRENGCSHKSSTEWSEKSSLSSGPLKTSSRLAEKAPPTDQKCSKSDRGVKRGMKSKQTGNPESTGVKVSETRPGNKGDQTPEPTAKRTVRPYKSTAEPTVASSPAQEHQLKPITSHESAPVPFAPQEGKSESQTKACQDPQKEKKVEKKTDRTIQVSNNVRFFGIFISNIFSFFASIDQLHANEKN